MDMTVRQMQALSAIYLACFCRSLDIKHDSVRELVFHLLSILASDDLPGWEQSGTMLALNGRGDPLPNDLDIAVGDCNKVDFSRFVDCAVEVGIVDLYGAASNNPEKFLKECRQLLLKRNLSVPNSDFIQDLDCGDGHWGKPIPEEEYNSLTERIAKEFSFEQNN